MRSNEGNPTDVKALGQMNRNEENSDGNKGSGCLEIHPHQIGGKYLNMDLAKVER
ncbi:hypothetical protein A2U01_0083074, partial [Trifolium medium]|nr:hypothetical protein [Trifolium medium]